MSTVTIGAGPLALDELFAIADGAEVRLDADARTTIEASRAVIDRMMATGEPVYGLNTGVGHEKDTRLPDEALRTMQVMLLMAHAGGLGDPEPTEIVRGAMAVRLAGIARGGSGASPALADTLAAMLNAGVHPVVPSRGSVGMADLGQLATIGQVALGHGHAEIGGEIVAGAEALARARIEPLVLGPKDGLTFMSCNAFSIAEGAFAVRSASQIAELADIVAALSMEATASSPSVVQPSVGAAKPYPGQIASCAGVLAALDGGDLLDRAPRSVQAPLSFRVIPQVHGAVREAIDAAARAVLVELHGRGDNPLVSIDDDAIVHNGNFDAIVMAIAFDQLRIALAHLGHASERRMNHLWDRFFAGGPPSPTAAGPPPDLFGLRSRYPAAASYAELRRLASPATLDVPPLDIGVEDVASNAPLSIASTAAALDLVWELLSIEVLLAGDLLATLDPAPTLGRGTGEVVARAREAIAALGGDRSAGAAQRAVSAVLRP